MATRFGSRTLPEDHLVEVDAPCIQELRRAGALIFGKTTTSEFGNKIVGDCPLTGITRNPWNLDRTAGGSSGGAGAALAARMGPWRWDRTAVAPSACPRRGTASAG